jgi:hypothetical protein
MSDDDDLITVTRTGGFTALTLTTTINLATLPEPQRATWESALKSGLDATDQGHPAPDEFTYRIQRNRTNTDRTLNESAIPSALRTLLMKAARPGGGPAALSEDQA